jgi:transposase-like protein
MIQPENQAKWQGLILDQETSGQSIAGFCRTRELSASLFYNWRRRLREEATPGFVEVQVAKPRLKNGRARHSGCAPGSTIEVRLSNGRSLMVAAEFDASHLRALLAVVESAS